MTKSDQFWSLIDQSLISLGLTEQEAMLKHLLSQLSDDAAIGAFTELHRQVNRAELYQLINAAFFFSYRFSDDSWEYHKYWLVSRGKAEFELALSDPDTFYSRFYDEITVKCISAEEIGSCFASNLLVRGIDMFNIALEPAKFSGVPANESEWPVKFPKIHEKKTTLGIDGWSSVPLGD